MFLERTVRLGRFAGCTEIPDQVRSGFILLLACAQHLGDSVQGKWQAEHGGVHHGTLPLRRVEETVGGRAVYQTA